MADQLARLKAALAARYALERELGRGGMATVYLARDLRHGRLVAIKVLRPEIAAALGPERFLREIQTAARLTHPHILPLHDSGEAAGSLFYVMPYIEGESLRDRLEREGQLPPTVTTWCTGISSRRTSCSRVGKRWWRTSGSRGRSPPPPAAS